MLAVARRSRRGKEEMVLTHEEGALERRFQIKCDRWLGSVRKWMTQAISRQAEEIRFSSEMRGDSDRRLGAEAGKTSRL